MVIDAAINGQGIALARTTLAAWDLINGRLVRPFPESMRLSKTYWIARPKATAALPKIVTFRDWLLAEAIDRFAPPLKRAVGHQGHGTKTDARITMPRGRGTNPGNQRRSITQLANSLHFPEPDFELTN